MEKRSSYKNIKDNNSKFNDLLFIDSSGHDTSASLNNDNYKSEISLNSELTPFNLSSSPTSSFQTHHHPPPYPSSFSDLHNVNANNIPINKELLYSNKENPDFRNDIEGLRGIAVLLVLLFHAQLPFLTGGFIGVDIFYTISGYVITMVLIKEYNKNKTIYLMNFFEWSFR